MGVPALSADGRAELRAGLLPSTEHLLLRRGQRSPSGNRVQPGLERSKHKPGKRRKPSSFLLLCFCSHEEQWQSLSEQLGTRGFLLGSPLARVGCSKALAARHVTKSPVGRREESLSSEARGGAVELLRKLVSSSQAGRGVTCSTA